MNIETLLGHNKVLEEKILILQNELKVTKDHLKKYTAPSNMKKYYENHKEEIKKRVKEYKEKTKHLVDPDIIKERNRRAYLKRKEKLIKNDNNEE
jgi:hypothetical protein